MPRWAIAIALLTAVVGSSASAKSARVQYPDDVNAFINRTGECGSLQTGDPTRRSWACDRLKADKASLLARYQGQPNIVEALNGHWIKVVQRLPARTRDR
jgi:hypothetical protein